MQNSLAQQTPKAAEAIPDCPACSMSLMGGFQGEDPWEKGAPGSHGNDFPGVLEMAPSCPCWDILALEL